MAWLNKEYDCAVVAHPYLFLPYLTESVSAIAFFIGFFSIEMVIPAVLEIKTASMIIGVNFSPRKIAEKTTVTTGNNEQSGATSDAIPDEYAMDFVRNAPLPKIPTTRQAIKSLADIFHENV